MWQQMLYMHREVGQFFLPVNREMIISFIQSDDDVKMKPLIAKMTTYLMFYGLHRLIREMHSLGGRESISLTVTASCSI